MPKKVDHGQHYIVAVTGHLKSPCQFKALYKRIYGTEGSREEVQQLSNRLNPNRSNPGTDMLGICLEALPELHDMTVAEFFGISASK